MYNMHHYSFTTSAKVSAMRNTVIHWKDSKTSSWDYPKQKKENTESIHSVRQHPWGNISFCSLLLLDLLSDASNFNVLYFQCLQFVASITELPVGLCAWNRVPLPTLQSSAGKSQHSGTVSWVETSRSSKLQLKIMQSLFENTHIAENKRFQLHFLCLQFNVWIKLL